MPFATVPTYTERPHLTEELGVKLGKRYGGAGLAYAITVIGLGGTGKTQLVLHYIEGHEEEYDTILWIDVRSEETARSSYERCCRALCLPIEAPTVDVPLQDIPAVQAVLLRLRSEDQNKRWLVVVDNADDLSWDVSGVVPKGKAGTVIVTSQDAQASRLLGGRTPTVRVDAMEPEEAVRLVSNYFDEPLCRGDGCLALVEEITEYLDRLALAMDLAGAQVQADVENGDDLATALRQYIADYKRSQDRLLRDEEFARRSLYKKTVWTAWETSLASLGEAEDRQADVYPVQLLSFVTLLDRANVQDELFRLASLGLEDACNGMNVEVPTWMQRLLSKGDDNQWDDFSYRASVKLLLRYGLVRPVGDPWKGITMHSLVQWRAGVGIDREEYWRLYLVFMAAACMNIEKVAGNVRFRRHVVVHLPLNKRLVNESNGVEGEGLRWMWSWVGHVLWQEGRWKLAEKLHVEVLDARRRVLGEEHPDTIGAIASLAATYQNQGHLKEAEELEIKVLEARQRVLGEEHSDTIRAMDSLSVTYSMRGIADKAEELKAKVVEVSRRVLGNEHPDTIRAMANLAATYQNQGRSKKAEELLLKVLEARQRVLGEENPDTIMAMANLAVTYWNQGRLKEARELDVKVLEVSRRVLGEEHPDTIKTINSLSVTFSMRGNEVKAEELEAKVMEVSRRVLGNEHPDTIRAMANLAATYRDQGRSKVLEARRRVLGEKHPHTIMAIANLGVTGRKQGGLKEAEELEVKVLETRQRVLGEEHPDTIRAIASLAHTKRALGQNCVAIDLMTQSAMVSSRVLGDDHPDCRSRHEQAALWSSVTSDSDSDDHHDIDQAVHSDDDGGVAVW